VRKNLEMISLPPSKRDMKVTKERHSLKDFRIEIPEELIAQYPTEKRGQSKLLVLDIKKGTIVDDRFSNFVHYLSPNDCIVYNDAKVINARLFGLKNGSGGRVELLLTRKLSETCWHAIIRPARRIRLHSTIELKKHYSLEIIEDLGEGMFTVCFSYPLGFDELKEIGEIPLPKYIRRKPIQEFDDDRYQTVFSTRFGAVASPTAGLHFTKEIIRQIEDTGAVFVPVTLFVDWGTFKPVREEDYRKHKIHKELFEISDESARTINRCVDEGRRVLCIGTTSVRTLETAIRSDGHVRGCRGETDLYIYPGYNFKITRAILTNFHMPDSTLILLIAAFAGKELIETAYAHAVAQKYRFFSYGDAMLLIQ